MATRLALTRTITSMTSYYKLTSDNWLRRDFDNEGLMLRSIELLGNRKRGMYLQYMYPVWVEYLHSSKHIDDGIYKNTLGYILADCEEDARTLIEHVTKHKQHYNP